MRKIYGINASRHLNMPGYEEKTTFMNDFAIAEQFGVDAVKDTFDRVIKEWGNDIEYMTELCLVVNQLCWHFYEKDEDLCNLYYKLYQRCIAHVYEEGRFIKGELDYFYRVTD